MLVRDVGRAGGIGLLEHGVGTPHISLLNMPSGHGTRSGPRSHTSDFVQLCPILLPTLQHIRYRK